MGVLGLRARCMAQTREIPRCGERLRFLFSCKDAWFFSLKFLSLLFQIRQMKQCFIPATFQRVGDKPIGWIYFLITPFGKSNFVFSALESHLPLTQNGLVAYFEFLQSGECKFEFGWLQRFQHFPRNGGIEQATTKAHAILGRQSFAMLSVAKVGRINAAVAGVADGDCVATVTAHDQPLKQGKAFTRLCAFKGGEGYYLS